MRSFFLVEIFSQRYPEDSILRFFPKKVGQICFKRFACFGVICIERVIRPNNRRFFYWNLPRFVLFSAVINPLLNGSISETQMLEIINQEASFCRSFIELPRINLYNNLVSRSNLVRRWTKAGEKKERKEKKSTMQRYQRSFPTRGSIESAKGKQTYNQRTSFANRSLTSFPPWTREEKRWRGYSGIKERIFLFCLDKWIDRAGKR